MDLMLLLIVFILLIGVLPTWPYSKGWGYYPGGLIALVLIILIILILLGYLQSGFRLNLSITVCPELGRRTNTTLRLNSGLRLNGYKIILSHKIHYCIVVHPTENRPRAGCNCIYQRGGPCHSEHIRFTQCKLLQGSKDYTVKRETLR